MRKISLFLLLCLFSSALWAGGYGVSVQSQKLLGMAHAGTGFYLDGSALFFNPGALAQQQKKWEITFGVNTLFSTGYYQSRKTRASEQTNNPMGTPAELYASYKINKHLTAGLGFYTPYGSGIQWPDGWEGRALITAIQLKSYFLQPTLSYKVTDWLSVGAGFVFATGGVVLEKDIPAINGSLKLEDKAKWGYGYNVGVYLQPNEKLSVGIAYRSKVLLKIEKGEATFTLPSSLANTKIYTEDLFTAELPMISSINLGAAYRFNEQLTLAADINFNNWSEYEVLDIQFEKNSTLGSPQMRNYKNTITARIGAQYTVDEKWTARAGFYYDPTPVRKDYFTPETPSMNNLGFTAGGSFRASERLTVDASLLIINGLERYVGYASDNFKGDFRSFAIAPGIGISYSF